MLVRDSRDTRSSGLDRAHSPEVDLVDRARRGDEAAFALLVEQHGAAILSLAYASTLNRADAEDIVQETFLSAWRGLPGFRGDAAFGTWLYELARNRCADRARRAAVRPALARDAETRPAEDTAPSRTEHRKTALTVLEVAAGLPLAQRQAVLMRDIQGLSYDEIADVQGVPLGTVRSRIAAGRARIADEVGEA